VEHVKMSAELGFEKAPVCAVDELVPRLAVARSLSVHLVDDTLEAICAHTGDRKGAAVGCGQCKGDRDADEVDVRYVGEYLLVVVRKFGEGPVHVDIGIGWVGYTGVYNVGARIHKERQMCVDYEPDTPTGHLGDCRGNCVAWGTEWDSHICGDACQWLSWGGRRVNSLAIGLDEDGFVAVVESKPSDVREDIA
jgi:hypothetical protein